MDRDRFSDEYDPDPDDRPTLAEARADEEGPLTECPQCGEIALDEDASPPRCRACGLVDYQPDEQGQEGGTCIICDGVGHAYIVGWHEVPGKGTQPIIGGGPCPLEEPGGWDPREQDEYDPF